MIPLPEHLHSIAKTLFTGHYNLIYINNELYARNISTLLIYIFYDYQSKIGEYYPSQRERDYCNKLNIELPDGWYQNKKGWIITTRLNYFNCIRDWGNTWYFDNTSNTPTSLLN